MCVLLTFIIYSGDPLGDEWMRAKNKPALVGRDGIVAREKGKYSILDNFTQRICRSVILTTYSIPYFCEIVKGVETKFEEFLMETADIYIKGANTCYNGRKTAIIELGREQCW